MLGYVRKRSEPLISTPANISSSASANMKETLPEAGTVEMTEAFHAAMAALEQDNSSSKEIQQLELRMKREIMRLEKEVERAEQLYNRHRQKMAQRQQSLNQAENN
ncbi:uncharacterized protein LOC134856205 isoform X2 [Symsagittifera roscoffensis]